MQEIGTHTFVDERDALGKSLEESGLRQSFEILRRHIAEQWQGPYIWADAVEPAAFVTGALRATRIEEMDERDADAATKSPFRMIWIAGGTLSVGLGVAGLVLPLVPTTPFVILAAWCFARSSPELRDRLANSRMLGPSLRDWERGRAIARRAKVSASVLLVFLVLLSVALQVPTWIVVLQGLAAIGVSLFLWTRPDARR
jgi:uncharacterized membrane protein YbaN (DUF454 family)